MRQQISFLFVTVILSLSSMGCKTAPHSSGAIDHTWLIVPGKSVGMIDRQATQASLKKSYGSRAAPDEEHILDEQGAGTEGWILYSKDPNRRVEIVLSPEHTPKEAWLKGRVSKFKTKEGLTLGMTLKELEALNGKPFELLGFGWDYGGFVSSWSGGKLAGVYSKEKIAIQLGAREDVWKKLKKDEIGAVSGESAFSTNSDLIQRLDLRVIQIQVRL